MLKKYLTRLEYLDHLIRMRGTGSPVRLARRLHMSERSVYGYIEVLKSLGAPVKYSKYKKSYYYEIQGKIEFKFKKL